MSKKILIVDDFEDNIILLQEILQTLDFETDYVENGQQAIDAVIANDYCLVMMDIEMPIMNGFEATEEIRALPSPKSKVPVIALSAHSSSFFEERLKSTGMNGFVPKPYNISSISEMLEKYL